MVCVLCVMKCCLFCLYSFQFVVKGLRIVEDEEEEIKDVKKKKKRLSLLVNKKWRCAMWDSASDVAIRAPHNKFTEFKCHNGNMQFGTQLQVDVVKLY